tara:strand:+ start:179 stop:967 length:789 start_codon:yes stop_codon:yes gene_type:complete
MTKKYFLPLFFIDIVRILRALKLKITYKNILRPNIDHKDKFQDEDVFIIGNGPAITNENLSKLRNKNIITMNDFHKSMFSKEMNIVAHCSGEPHTSSAWTDPSIMIENIKAESFWFNIFDYTVMSKIETITKDINYVNPGYSSEFFKSKINLCGICFNYQTTAQLAIQVAIYMGFKNIYLLGFNHDWLASPKMTKHFFSNEKQENDKIDEKSYLDLIEMCSDIWNMYSTLNLCSQKKSARIINLNKESFLDVFEFQEFDDVI